MSSHPLQIPKPSQTPQNHQTQIENMQNNNKTTKPSTSYNKWTREQDILYVRFLRGNIERMKKTTFRKVYNKFKKMSEYITSKDSFQCRSHHQKMIKKHSNVQTIIEKLSIKNAQMPKKKPKRIVGENKMKLKPQIFEKAQSQRIGTEAIEHKEIENRVQFFIPEQKQDYNRNNSEMKSFQTVSISASKNEFQQIPQTSSGQMNRKKYNIKENNLSCPQIKNVEMAYWAGRTVRHQEEIINRQRYYNQISQNSQKTCNHQCPCHWEAIQFNRNHPHPDFRAPLHNFPLLHQYWPTYTHPHYYSSPFLYNHPQYPLSPYPPSYHEIIHYQQYTNPKIGEPIVKIQVKQQE